MHLRSPYFNTAGGMHISLSFWFTSYSFSLGHSMSTVCSLVVTTVSTTCTLTSLSKLNKMRCSQSAREMRHPQHICRLWALAHHTQPAERSKRSNHLDAGLR